MAVITYSQALTWALREEMRRDERVICLGEDIKDSTFGATRGLYAEFGPRRVIGTPISESAIAGATGEVPEDDYTIPFGRASVRRRGTDVTIVALQRMVDVALEAAEGLAAEGIEAEVIDPRTVVPLDVETIVASVKKTHRAAVVHEAQERFGFGAELVALLVTHAFDHLDAPPVRIANPNVPTPFNRALEALSIPSAAAVQQAVRGLMG